MRRMLEDDRYPWEPEEDEGASDVMCAICCNYLYDADERIYIPAGRGKKQCVCRDCMEGMTAIDLLEILDVDLIDGYAEERVLKVEW